MIGRASSVGAADKLLVRLRLGIQGEMTEIRRENQAVKVMTRVYTR